MQTAVHPMMVQCQSTPDGDLYFPASIDTGHVVVSSLPCQGITTKIISFVVLPIIIVRTTKEQ